MDEEGIVVYWEYIQEFVETNYGKKLTKKEMKELRYMVWEFPSELENWISEAVDEIRKQS